MATREYFIAPGSMALAVLFGLSPLSAAANCQVWQLPPAFNAVQDNGFNVVFELTELGGGYVKGWAHYYTGDDFHLVKGWTTGYFDGHALNIGVDWPGQARGVYRGYIDSGGYLAGFTRDVHNPTNQVRWLSKQIFQCAPPLVDEVPKPPNYVDPGIPKGIVKKPPGADVLIKP
jgi:hypothetical protein